MNKQDRPIVLTDELGRQLKAFLKPEDFNEQIVNLVRIGFAAHEQAFDQGENMGEQKERFLEFVGSSWDQAKGEEQERSRSILLGLSLGHYRNFGIGGLAAFVHAVNFPDVSKDAILAFVSRAWDKGVHQRRVYSMEVEGAVMNEAGIACALAAEIALSGKRTGLVTKHAV